MPQTRPSPAPARCTASSTASTAHPTAGTPCTPSIDAHTPGAPICATTTTTAIAKWDDSVQVEALHCAGKTRNRRLGRALDDTGMAGFVRMLEYKYAEYGTACPRMDRWCPTTQTCSGYGAVKQSLLLSECTSSKLLSLRSWLDS